MVWGDQGRCRATEDADALDTVYRGPPEALDLLEFLISTCLSYLAHGYAIQNTTLTV